MAGAIIANNGAVYLTAKAKGSLSKAVINHSGIIANRLTQNARGGNCSAWRYAEW